MLSNNIQEDLILALRSQKQKTNPVFQFISSFWKSYCYTSGSDFLTHWFQWVIYNIKQWFHRVNPDHIFPLSGIHWGQWKAKAAPDLDNLTLHSPILYCQERELWEVQECSLSPSTNARRSNTLSFLSLLRSTTRWIQKLLEGVSNPKQSWQKKHYGAMCKHGTVRNAGWKRNTCRGRAPEQKNKTTCGIEKSQISRPLNLPARFPPRNIVERIANPSRCPFSHILI